MQYRLRVYVNDKQAVSSIGYVFIILSIVNLYQFNMPLGFVFLFVGALLITYQLRGKIIYIDTKSKFLKKSFRSVEIKDAQKILFKPVKLSQIVNSRVSSASFNQIFYQAFLFTSSDKHLISSNKNKTRDLSKLESIAQDFDIPMEIMD